MAQFYIEGPYVIPCEEGKKLIAEDLSSFWDNHKSIASAVGCYIFAIRAGGDLHPYMSEKLQNHLNLSVLQAIRKIIITTLLVAILKELL